MITTIQLDSETRDRLKAYAQKNETYNQVVNRLIDMAEAEEVKQ